MFSIIVPIYNTQKQYLSRCIESLLNQTIDKYEIILVDDGSNKECKEFIEQYSKYDKITIIHKEHEGVCTARNIGINVAKNEYIIFVDSDDYVETDMCEKVEKCIIENNRPDILCFDACLEYKNKSIKIPLLECENKIMTNNDKKKLLVKTICDQGIDYKEKFNIAGMVWSKAYNKVFLNKKKLYFDYKVFHAEDLLFNLYAFESANIIFYCKYPIYHYARNNKSLSNNFNEKFVKNDEYVLSRTENFIRKYGKTEEFYNALYCLTAKMLKDYIIRIYLNKKNNYTYKEAKEKICKLIDKEIYREALNNINTKYLRTDQKIIYYLIKHKKIFLLKLITVIRNLRYTIVNKIFN